MLSATTTANLTMISPITRSKYYCVWTSAVTKKDELRSTMARSIIARLGALCPCSAIGYLKAHSSQEEEELPPEGLTTKKGAEAVS